jgi:hypothetical protein
VVGAAVRWDQRVTCADFLIIGLNTGAWTALIPAVKAQPHPPDGTLGAALHAFCSY